MAGSPLKKNEFIDLLTGSFLQKYPGWFLAHQNRRDYFCMVGRNAADACFVWIAFSCRPDRYWFGQSVGWAPSREDYVARLGARENPPVYPNDGSLRRIRGLDRVRQFQLPEMARSISSLYIPWQNYSLETTPPDDLRELMLREIEEYALPYLCLMLKQRHGIETTPAGLGAAGKL